MKRIAAVLMLAAMSWAAQDNKNAQTKPPAVVAEKLFVLKYADPVQVINLVRALGGSADQNTQMRAIAVTADKGAMAVIEDAVKQLDTPAAAPKNIELTVYLVMGSNAESDANSVVPKELESVVAQLKNAFPFKNYRQMDVIETRTRTGERVNAYSAGGTVMTRASAAPEAVGTTIRIRAVGLGQDGSTVRLDDMDASLHWQGMLSILGLNASVDVKEGQKVVVGRIGVERDQALFLVLTAHVVQ